jgi:hypothetical protein
MGGFFRAMGDETGQIYLLTRSDVDTFDDAGKDGEGCLWLIRGYCMSGVVDARKRESTYLA